MATYAKHWTDKFNDQFYQSLKLIERGMWNELIDLCKLMGDTGRIFLRNFQTLGSLTGCDGKTARKILGKFLENGKIELKIEKHGIEIYLPNYHKHQHLRKPSDIQNPGNFQETSDKIREDKINIEDKINKPSKTAVDKSEENEIKDCLANLATRVGKVFKNPHRFIGGLRKKHKPEFIAYAFYRLRQRQYAQGLPPVDDPIKFLQNILLKRPVVASIAEGGDDSAFREERTVKEWHDMTFGLSPPPKREVSKGFTQIGDAIK
jgi:hypothetical protein